MFSRIQPIMKSLQGIAEQNFRMSSLSELDQHSEEISSSGDVTDKPPSQGFTAYWEECESLADISNIGQELYGDKVSMSWIDEANNVSRSSIREGNRKGNELDTMSVRYDDLSSDSYSESAVCSVSVNKQHHPGCHLKTRRQRTSRNRPPRRYPSFGVHRPLPRQAVEILERWLSEHRDYPYPDKMEKQQLVAQTHLRQKQVQNWLSRVRYQMRIHKTNDPLKPVAIMK